MRSTDRRVHPLFSVFFLPDLQREREDTPKFENISAMILVVSGIMHKKRNSLIHGREAHRTDDFEDKCVGRIPGVAVTTWFRYILWKSGTEPSDQPCSGTHCPKTAEDAYKSWIRPHTKGKVHAAAVC